MKKKLRALLFNRQLPGLSLLMFLALLMSGAATATVRYPYSNGTFAVDPATLEITLLRAGKPGRVSALRSVLWC